MFKPTALLQTSEVEKQAILKEYNINEVQFEDHVHHLYEWINKTVLPKEENCRNKFRVFLLNSKLSLEKTKRSVEAYYRLRTIYSFIYDRLLPNTEDYKKFKKLMKTIVVPRLTPDLCRITINKISDPNGEAIDGTCYFIFSLMVAEIRFMDSDFFLSNIVIVDCQEFQFKNFVKFTPLVTQKLSNLASAISLRVKSVHFVNMPPIIDHLMTLIKSVIPAKFLNKLHLHKDFESLHEHISKEYLPSNYNGYLPSIEELHGEWCEEIERREEDFMKLLQVKSKEYIKMAIDEREVFGMGSEGSFKKLNID